MREPLQLFRSLSTLALSALLCLSFVKSVEASSALPLLNTSPGSEESSSSSSSSSSSTVSSTSYSYAYAPPPLPDDKTRTIRIWGSLPATYVGKVAAFGNTLQEDFAANLMLPPDDPSLCEFPESLKNITSSSSSPFLESNMLPYKIALFVSLNGCSAEQKARVALEIRQKVTPRLELLILYSTNPSDDGELESLQLDPDSSWQGNSLNLDGERNLGILHVPQQYAAGINVRIRVNTNSRNADPHMGMPTNEDWKLEVEVSPLLGYDDDGYYSSSHGGGSGGAYRHGNDDDDLNAGSMYWFRIVLFTLLIVSPCCRAGYLWHAGGGRFHWRRNDNGRIVGILYVPPIPAWLSTGVMQQPQDNRAGKLTMEQFNTLPEIKYMPNGSSSHNDDDDNGGDCDDDIDAVDENNIDPASEEEEVDTSKSKKKAAAVVQKKDSEGGESSLSSDDEFPALAQNNTEVTEAESMETAEIAFAPAISTDRHESTEDDLELGDTAAAVKSKDKEQEATKASVPEASAASDADNANSNADQNNAQDECPESCKQASCPKKFKPTTSSMCSICIDDFEEGESLILLPRCQHAFHKDCILPWLTERQGCCPMCKCNVLKEDDDEEEEEDGDDDDSDSALSFSAAVQRLSRAETNENERNNNVDLVEPEVVVAPPVRSEQSGTR